jgi:O-antigen/teichoic acid export membrane protein
MSIWYKLTDKTYFGTFITVGGALLTIFLNYLLIPYFGYTGSSWAMLLCYLTMTLACYFFGQKYYPIPYSIGKSTLYILVTILLVFTVNAVQLNNQWLATGFHAAVILVYAGSIYALEKRYLFEPA